MKTLKVCDLVAKDRERAKQNHETYKMLYKQCVDHIRRRNDMGSMSTTYFVSEYVLGRPLFTHSHALRYIKDKLERGKFSVEIEPVSKYLVISWGGEKEREIRKRVPTDLGIDMARYRERRRKTRLKMNRNPVEHEVEQTGSKKKSKHTPRSTQSQEPLSLRISRLNAALSLGLQQLT
jgi:hypothetical protein